MKQISKAGQNVLRGMRDGIPIGLGYLAVSFSLGIAAQSAGISVIQGFVMSFLNNASAGEYAGIAAIRAGAPYLEIAVLILITNARYLLMSCALSQKLSPDLSLGHRMLIGFDVTDELFGISVAQPYPVPPSYIYGAYAMALPMWALGTAVGIAAGNVLPAVAVTSLSAAIYGMFIAIVIPPCRKDRAILLIVPVSFLVSGGVSLIPWVAAQSESLRIIVLTLALSVAAAVLFPRKDEEEEAETV